VPRPCSMVHMLPHRQAWHRRTISSRLRCARSRCCVWPPPHRGDTPHRSDTALCSACCPRRPPPAPTISCRSATRGSAIVPATAYPVNNARTHMPPRPPACGAAGSLPARLATGRGHSRQRAPWPAMAHGLLRKSHAEPLLASCGGRPAHPQCRLADPGNGLDACARLSCTAFRLTSTCRCSSTALSLHHSASRSASRRSLSPTGGHRCVATMLAAHVKLCRDS